MRRCLPGVVPDGQVVPRLTTEVMPEKEAAYGVEDASAHFHHVLHDFLYGCVWDGHVDRADGDHEVETGDDVPGVLDEFVEICEVVSGLGVCVVEVV